MAVAAVPTTVLSVKNLKKRIKNKEIIKGISFDVFAGEIFGFLGPNGSGKTTTIRMLVDLIRPTEGSIQICGHDVHKEHNQAMRHVGCIVENPELYSYLTGWENLEHFARMLPNVDDKRIQEVVEIVSMDQRIHDKVRTYSLGMRQRLGIAQALLGRPSLLILDEPTNGLDPQGIKEMREFIQRLAAGGLSLFVSSHLLSEIQQMCHRVAIISHGEVIQVGAVDDLVAQGGKVVWSVSPADKAEGLLEASPLVQTIEEISQESPIGLPSTVKQIVTQMDKENVPQVSQHLMEEGISLYAVEIKNPTLEDLFLSLTEGERIE
ncbi:ABC transporter ATP-binding protein [Paenibacillus alginolyticus]|uniref:ABC transporter ATP-binding protein n=1 Tax=Paenibacillus alginolyticus TaxID=59839 RepID=A0ABT4GND7_9BACL|nr:ABC transporter ATP-binding protein [Paenibacillus alginolyticus]MCY9697721.1 ABC transporter ATP-binding protein [Paenibacillus alginolyticus]MEC0145389.1 ABC transporter ATP-binding protein [Paenibacillus alginolyticus]